MRVVVVSLGFWWMGNVVTPSETQRLHRCCFQLRMLFICKIIQRNLGALDAEKIWMVPF